MGANSAGNKEWGGIPDDPGQDSGKHTSALWTVRGKIRVNIRMACLDNSGQDSGKYHNQSVSKSVGRLGKGEDLEHTGLRRGSAQDRREEGERCAGISAGMMPARVRPVIIQSPCRSVDGTR